MRAFLSLGERVGADLAWCRLETSSTRYPTLNLGFASVPVSLERQILRTRPSFYRLALVLC